MLGDPQPSDVVALPRVTGVAPREVQPPEEQRPRGQFPQFLGVAAQPVPEDLGVGSGGGDVLAGDDPFVAPAAMAARAVRQRSWWARSRSRACSVVSFHRAYQVKQPSYIFYSVQQS
ncbi:hypothetical protein GCM10023238_24330 [Streptomyces heliomycini]